MRLALLVWIAATTMAAAAWAGPDWQNFGTVSSTLGVQTNRLCIGVPQNQRGRNSNLGCPSYAPSVTSVGNLIVSGSVTANSFVGDGSGLTGVTAGSSDRIVSGTGASQTILVAVSNTGYISLTQSGVNTGWFDPQRGFVTIGVSSTGPISGTNGYFSGNVGIGINNPTRKVEIAGSVLQDYILSVTNNDNTGSWRGGLLNLFPNLGAGQNGAIFYGGKSLSTNEGFGINYNHVGPNSASNYVSFNFYGLDNILTFNASGKVGVGTAGPATLLHVYDGNNNNIVSRLQAAGGGGNNYYDFLVTNSANSNGVGLFIKEGAVTRMRIDGNGNIGIGTTAPSTTLTVSGSQLTTSWTSINMNRTAVTPLEVSGTISATALIINGQTITGGASGDRITSGTSSVVVNSATSTISFTTAGSQRMTIDGSGNVGIGTATPSTMFQLGNGTSTAAYTYQSNSISDPQWSSNAYWTGSQWNRINTSYGSQNWWHDATNNILYLRMAPSGSNPITWGAANLYVDGNAGAAQGVSVNIRNSNAGGEAAFAVRNDVGYAAFELFGSTWNSTGLRKKALFTVDSNQTGGLGFATLGSAPITFATNGATNEQMRIDSGGNVGIGTTAPADTLHVSGTTRLVSNVAIGMNATPSATLDVSGTMRLTGASGNETCDDAHFGMIRLDPTTGLFQACVQ